MNESELWTLIDGLAQGKTTVRELNEKLEETRKDENRLQEQKEDVCATS